MLGLIQLMNYMILFKTQNDKLTKACKKRMKVQDIPENLLPENWLH